MPLLLPNNSFKPSPLRGLGRAESHRAGRLNSGVMPHPSDRLKSIIRANSEEIARLHARIHESFSIRDRSPEKRQEWQRACEIFHSRYDELAFPGGYNGALERIVAGDPESMEAAICFLEMRPYFFRSGYMFDALLRKTKRAPLSEEQVARLERILQAKADWRAQKVAPASGA